MYGLNEASIKPCFDASAFFRKAFGLAVAIQCPVMVEFVLLQGSFQSELKTTVQWTLGLCRMLFVS